MSYNNFNRLFVFEDIFKIISREFEEAINNVDSVQVNLGNSGHLNQDCTPDALNLYESLVTSYRWTDNVLDPMWC